MPIKACTIDGKQGFQYGSQTCYPHDGSDAGKAEAKAKAVKQAIAANGGTAPSDLSERDLADAGSKTCASCGKTRVADRFTADNRTADGLSAVCVQCRFETERALAEIPASANYRITDSTTRNCGTCSHFVDGKCDLWDATVSANGMCDSFSAKAMSERDLADLETVSLDGVPILAAGGPYKGDGSPEGGDTFDVPFLKEIALANTELAHQLKVPIKIGHSKEQRLLKNSGLWSDEKPAAGWLENFRVSGTNLMADLKGVPKKLADLIKLGAFRTRSVELKSVQEQTEDGKDGKEYPTAITGLALLGAKAPAVKTLDDIVALYSEDTPIQGQLFYHGEPEPGVRAIDFEEEWTFVEADEQNSDLTRHTSGMAATETKAESTTLSEELIQALAKDFGIEEEDDAKRREAVTAKLAEFAPKPEATPAVEEKTPPVEPEAKTETTEQATGLSEKELADVRESIGVYEQAKSERCENNLQVALRQGRIVPATLDGWRKFYAEADYDLVTEQLLLLPVNPNMGRAFGSDESDNDPNKKRGEDFYRDYAAATNVPTREAQT